VRVRLGEVVVAVTPTVTVGAAPIHRGEPGYSSKLDRDGDGIACEN
jgi:hypothetical protein